MNKTDINTEICIIGAGSGGLSVAAGAAQLGADVVLIEQHKMGGDCLNYGCVPSKALLAAAKAAHHARDGKRFGIHCENIRVDYAQVHDYVHQTIATIAPHDSVERFQKLGVNVIEEKAHFIDAHTLQAGKQTIRAKKIVIATGSKPSLPPIQNLDNVFHLTNETIFDLDTLPQHLIVIGGGPIGTEMAQAHRLLGSEVSMLIRSRLLPKDDPDCVNIIQQRLIDDGIDIKAPVIIDKVETDSNGITVYYEQDGVEQTLCGSHLLVAAGRTPDFATLNLDAAGIQYSDRGIQVDRRLRTNRKHIYAIGDVAGLPKFTHMAGYAAGIVIKNLLFRLPAKYDTHSLPWVTYTDPEIAHVGYTQTQLQQAQQPYKITETPYADIDRAQTDGYPEGKIKVLTDLKGHVLGVTIVGQHAGEFLMPWSLAIKRKLKLSAIADLIVSYPTLSELNKRAAGQYYTPLLFSDRTRRLVKWLSKLPG